MITDTKVIAIIRSKLYPWMAHEAINLLSNACKSTL